MKAAEGIIDRIPGEATKNMNAGKQNYTLDVPAGWSTKHQTFKSIEYYFLLAPKTAEDPNTNINVVTEHMQNLDVDAFQTAAIKLLKQFIPSASILKEGSIEANGIKGRWYSYIMAPEGIKVSLVCYIFPKDGVAYIITAGTQPEDAARYRRTFDSVARSLKFSE